MAEVNEAWRVLGDSNRRGRYDSELAAIAAHTDARTTGTPTGRATAGTHDAPAASVHPGSAMPARVPWRFMGAMAVAGVALVVVAHVFTGPQVESVPDGILRTADCVVLSATLEASEVACSGAHDAVVSVLVPFDATCPSDTEAYRDRQGMGIACVQRVGP